MRAPRSLSLTGKSAQSDNAPYPGAALSYFGVAPTICCRCGRRSGIALNSGYPALNFAQAPFSDRMPICSPRREE